MKFLKNINPSKIKTDEKSCKNIIIYYIRYLTSNLVKPLYLIKNKRMECIEESNANIYLTTVSNDEGNNRLKKHKELLKTINDLIRSTRNNKQL